MSLRTNVPYFANLPKNFLNSCWGGGGNSLCGGMALQVISKRHSAGDHGFGLRPIFFDEEGEVEMADEAGDEGGGEEAVEDAAKIDKVPAEAKEGKGKEVAEGLPEDHTGQDH